MRRYSVGSFVLYFNDMPTHIELFKPHIEMSSYAFTGGIELDESGTFSIADAPSTDEYTGTPSRHIDESWKRLLAGTCGNLRTFESRKLTFALAGLNLDVLELESPDVVGRTFKWPGDEHYFTGSVLRSRGDHSPSSTNGSH